MRLRDPRSIKVRRQPHPSAQRLLWRYAPPLGGAMIPMVGKWRRLALAAALGLSCFTFSIAGQDKAAARAVNCAANRRRVGTRPRRRRPQSRRSNPRPASAAFQQDPKPLPAGTRSRSSERTHSQPSRKLYGFHEGSLSPRGRGCQCCPGPWHTLFPAIPSSSFSLLGFHFSFREHIMIASHPRVQGWKQENAHRQVGDQSADDYNGEWPLRIGADIVRHGGRQQA